MPYSLRRFAKKARVEVENETCEIWSEPKTGLATSFVNLTHYRPQRCRSEREKFILEDLSSSALSQLKKYHVSGTLNLII